MIRNEPTSAKGTDIHVGYLSKLSSWKSWFLSMSVYFLYHPCVEMQSGSHFKTASKLVYPVFVYWSVDSGFLATFPREDVHLQVQKEGPSLRLSQAFPFHRWGNEDWGGSDLPKARWLVSVRTTVTISQIHQQFGPQWLLFTIVRCFFMKMLLSRHRRFLRVCPSGVKEQ